MRLFDSVSKKVMDNKYNFILVLFLMALPPILDVIYIKTYGVNIIFWDDFDCCSPRVEKLFADQFTFNDIFSLFDQHGEHRLFFPRIIILISAYLTHYNTIIEMYISWFLTIITLFLILKMYNIDIKNIKSLIMAIPISWIIFNFGRQSEIVLWGSPGIVGNLTILGFVTSIYMLEKTERIDHKFIFAIFCGLVSSFSFLNGLLIWPIGFVFIILSKMRNRFTLLITWVIIGTMTMAIYFYNWIKPSHHPSLFFAIDNFIVGTRYLLANIGAPMASEQSSAIVIGIIFIILTIITLKIVIKNKIMVENAKWITLILFSLASSVAMTIGRSGFGVEQALSSRYTMFTSFGFIGLYLIISNLYNNNKNQKYAILYGMILSIILIGTAIGYLSSADIGRGLSTVRENDAYFLTNYKWASDEDLKNLYPIADIVRKRAEILEKYSLNVFYSYVQDWDTYKRVDGGMMSIDNINEKVYSKDADIKVDRNSSISFKGWAVDDKTKDGTVKTYILFNDGKGDIIIPTRKIQRSDVENYFGIKSYEQSGWSATILPKNFKDVCYNISVRILRTNDKEYYELNGEKPICFN